MNKRLCAIEELVSPGIGLIDVGTDHGYLPISLAKHGYPGTLIAADIGKGPLSAAQRSAENEGLLQRIQFQLCDGLDLCDPETIDTIVIAGMGGDTICGILDRAEWCMDKRFCLILQPMTRAEVLRYWLTNNEFVIDRERLVCDGGEIYSLLSARFGGKQKLRDAELYSGAFSQIRQEALWPDYSAALRKRMEKQILGLRQSCREPGRLALAEHVLIELREEERTRANCTGDL